MEREKISEFDVCLAFTPMTTQGPLDFQYIDYNGMILRLQHDADGWYVNLPVQEAHITYGDRNI